MFRVDAGSGLPIYRQLVGQVRREVMLGRLSPGDQLPSLTEVVEALAINPNTVVKAYAELEHEGLVVRRQGTGTFITAVERPDVFVAPAALRTSLQRWVRRARDSGLSNEQIQLVFSVAVDDHAGDGERSAAGGVA